MFSLKSLSAIVLLVISFSLCVKAKEGGDGGSSHNITIQNLCVPEAMIVIGGGPPQVASDVQIIEGSVVYGYIFFNGTNLNSTSNTTIKPENRIDFLLGPRQVGTSVVEAVVNGTDSFFAQTFAMWFFVNDRGDSLPVPPAECNEKKECHGMPTTCSNGGNSISCNSPESRKRETSALSESEPQPHILIPSRSSLTSSNQVTIRSNYMPSDKKRSVHYRRVIPPYPRIYTLNYLIRGFD